MMEREPDSIHDSKLAEALIRLIAAYHPERIYLFGSQARGEAGPDSDYDVLVVVPDDAPPELRRSRRGYQALRGTGIAVDVLVWPRAAFESRLLLKASLPAVIEREGKLLYAAEGVVALSGNPGHGLPVSLS